MQPKQCWEENLQLLLLVVYSLTNCQLLEAKGLKKRKSKCEISRRKDIVKIRVDTGEINKRHATEKISKSKIFFLKYFKIEIYSTVFCQFQVDGKVIQLYIRVYSFLDSFLLEIITRYCIQFPVLHGRSLLFIYFIYSRVYMLKLVF